MRTDSLNEAVQTAERPTVSATECDGHSPPDDRECPPMAALTRNDASRRIVISALAAGLSQEQAAEAAGTSARTVRRWLTKGMADEVAEARAEVIARATAVLGSSALLAAESLREMLTDDETPRGDRLRAAMAVLRTAREWRESEVLEERIRDVEAALSTRGVSSE